MNYKTASDKELMIELTAKLYECEQWCLNGDESEFYHCGIDGNQYYSYPVLKMTWADMGPVIEELGITVDGNGMAHVVDGYDAYNHFTNCIGFPLRAAVIVAIQVLESKTEETL